MAEFAADNAPAIICIFRRGLVLGEIIQRYNTSYLLIVGRTYEYATRSRRLTRTQQRTRTTGNECLSKNPQSGEAHVAIERLMAFGISPVSRVMSQEQVTAADCRVAAARRGGAEKTPPVLHILFCLVFPYEMCCVIFTFLCDHLPESSV